MRSRSQSAGPSIGGGNGGSQALGLRFAAAAPDWDVAEVATLGPVAASLQKWRGCAVVVAELVSGELHRGNRTSATEEPPWRRIEEIECY
jgi:hypothetical protein